MQNIRGNKISALGVSPKWMKSKIYPWKKEKRKKKKYKKISENNGQLCFHGSCLDLLCQQLSTTVK